MIKLNKDYSDYVDMTDGNYPNGKAVNASTSESFDGTPVVADLLNDIVGAHQAMYKKAYGNTTGVSGTADSVTSSQFADAVAKYADDKDTAHADLRGPNAHGATVEATPGQIATRDELGNLQVADAVNDEDAVNLKVLTEGLDTKSPLAGSSSLTTCAQGTFAAAATKGVDTAVTSGSGNLPTSGAVASALSNYALCGATTLDADESNFWANNNMKVFKQSSWGIATTNFPFDYGVYLVLPTGDGLNLNIIGANQGGAIFKFGRANKTNKTIDWTDYAKTTDLSSYAPLNTPVFTRQDTSHDGGEIQLQRSDSSKATIRLDIYDDSFRIFSAEGTGFFINFAAKTAGVWDKNFADAAFKGIDTAVTSGSANLPTSDAVASALAANFACTYISINGGADIGANQRYVIDNPYPDYEIACSVEIYYGGKWGSINNSIFNNDSGGYGVMANTWGTQIVVQTGNIAIVGDSITSCNPFNTAAGAPIYTAPCRVKVWKVGPKVS